MSEQPMNPRPPQPPAAPAPESGDGPPPTAWDQALMAKLGELPPPVGLEARILAAAASGARPRAPRLHWGLFSGAAAAVALLALGLTFVFRPQTALAAPDVARVRAAIESACACLSELQHGSGFESLSQFLAARGAPVPAELPAGLLAEKGFACRTFLLEGVPVGLVCFQSEGQVFHLFVFERDRVRGAEIPQPQIESDGTHATATWTHGTQVFVLATEPANAARLPGLVGQR